MGIINCHRLPLYSLLFIHISIHMPVPKKISLHPQATVENAHTDTAIQSAIGLDYANRNTINIMLCRRKNRSPSRIKKTGVSIRQVAAMHKIFSASTCDPCWRRTANMFRSTQSGNGIYNCLGSGFRGMVSRDVQMGIPCSARYF